MSSTSTQTCKSNYMDALDACVGGRHELNKSWICAGASAWSDDACNFNTLFWRYEPLCCNHDVSMEDDSCLHTASCSTSLTHVGVICTIVFGIILVAVVFLMARYCGRGSNKGKYGQPSIQARQPFFLDGGATEMTGVPAHWGSMSISSSGASSSSTGFRQSSRHSSAVVAAANAALARDQQRALSVGSAGGRHRDENLVAERHHAEIADEGGSDGAVSAKRSAKSVHFRRMDSVHSYDCSSTGDSFVVDPSQRSSLGSSMDSFAISAVARNSITGS